MINKITKQLAGIEDLAIGTGKVQQKRAGKTVTINKLKIPFQCETVEDMQLLDPAKFPFALVEGTPYIYTEEDLTGIPSSLGPGTWVVDQTPAGAISVDEGTLSDHLSRDGLAVARKFGLYGGQEITQAKMSALSLYCRTNRVTAKLSGRMTLNEDVVIDFDCDAGDCAITTDNMVTIGRAVNFARSNIKVTAPKVTAITTRPVAFESVGIRLMSLTDSEVTVPYAKGFTKNLQVYACGAPIVFNTVFIGKLDDGFINFAIETAVYEANPAYISYANENLFVGGHYSMSPQSIADNNRVNILGINRDRGINGNYWLKPSIEVPTYGAGQPTSTILRFSGCSENHIERARPEGAVELLFQNNSSNNTVTLGSQSDVYNVQVKEESGSVNNNIDRAGKNGLSRSLYNPMTYTNSLNADRSIIDLVEPIGVSIQNRVGNEENYSTRFICDGVKWKRRADTVPRIEVGARIKNGLSCSSGSGYASMVSSSFSTATNAVANGTAFVLNPLSIAQQLIGSASGINIVKIDYVLHRQLDNKFCIGQLIACARRDSASDHSVLSQSDNQLLNDFASVSVSLGSGEGRAGRISPRVSITDAATAGTIKVEMLIAISSSNFSSN